MSYVVNPFTGDLTPVTDIPSGSVIGPGSSVVGDVAVWNNTTGTLLADSGVKFTTDGTLSANSDSLTPTEKAVKTYVDNTAVTGTTTQYNTIVGAGTRSVASVTPGTAGWVLTSNGAAANPSYQALPASGITGTTTQYDVIVGAGTNSVGAVGPGTAGQVLQSGGAAANPAYSTATYPSTATSAGTLLRADGTNWAATTTTFPTTTAINDMLYASSANALTALTSVASRLLATNSSGVPGWRTTLDFNLSVIRSVGGSTVTMQVQNQSNTANSNAAYIATTSGSSAGDPLYRFETGASTWCIGSDNSVSSPSADPLTVSFNTVPGTNDYAIFWQTGEINYPAQSAFRATLSADATNVTGAGTSYTVAFNTESYDQNSDYNNTTYTFTAPVTGIYHFNVNLFLYGVVAATSIDCKLTNSAGTTLQDLFRTSGVGVVASSTNWVLSGSTNLKLTAADTVKVVIVASGEAGDVIDVQSGTTGTAFSGWLVC